MAAVVRELWGASPSFLVARNHKTIVDLVGHLPAHGKGLRVADSLWHKSGKTHTFYELTSIKDCEIHGQTKVFGTLVVEGRRQHRPTWIRHAFKHNWRFYASPEQIRSIEDKLGINSSNS